MNIRLFLTACLANLPAVVLAASPLAPVGQYNEAYVEEVPVSGANFLLGYQYTGSALPERFEPQIFVPVDFKGDTVCFSVRTSDGRYKAQNDFVVPAGQSGWSSLDVDGSAYKEIVAALVNQPNLAVMAFAGRCEQPAIDAPILPVRLSTSADQTLEVRATSLGWKSLIAGLQVGSGPFQTMECGKVPGLKNPAYDYSCSLPVKALKGQTGSGKAVLKLIRKGYGSVKPERYEAKLILGQ